MINELILPNFTSHFTSVKRFYTLAFIIVSGTRQFFVFYSYFYAILIPVRFSEHRVDYGALSAAGTECGPQTKDFPRCLSHIHCLYIVKPSIKFRRCFQNENIRIIFHTS